MVNPTFDPQPVTLEDDRVRLEPLSEDHAADLLIDGDLEAKSKDRLRIWMEGRIGASPTQGQIDSMAPDLFSILLRLPAAQLN